MDELAQLARASGQVQVETDHEQVVLRWWAPGTVRASVAMLGLTLAGVGVGTLAIVGPALLTSPLFCLSAERFAMMVVISTSS